jgi:hypothetical protein
VRPSAEAVEIIYRPREEEADRARPRFRERSADVELQRERRAVRSERRASAAKADDFRHATAPAFTTLFLVQQIAQEVMPEDKRIESDRVADQVAAYAATAARAETFLGPSDPIELVV